VEVNQKIKQPETIATFNGKKLKKSTQARSGLCFLAFLKWQKFAL